MTPAAAMTAASYGVLAMKKKKPVTLDIQLTPRARMGWPCFHCGMPRAKCKNAPHGFGRCCKRCRGKSSH